ncbi:MAG: hypothetical protein M1818_005384 [Claussenomyces sp. TS43310]|nr:MAG: hypothetical protein M1818_005384 [Claussenomyces sp. TS43310]
MSTGTPKTAESAAKMSMLANLIKTVGDRLEELRRSFNHEERAFHPLNTVQATESCETDVLKRLGLWKVRLANGEVTDVLPDSRRLLLSC